MAAIDRVQIEYERLKMLFLSVEQSKSELVDNLINEAAELVPFSCTLCSL